MCGFYNHHHNVWRFVCENDEGFWLDLSDSVREANKKQYVRRDLILTEFPKTRDVGRQISLAQGDAATQTEERRFISVEVQTVETEASVKMLLVEPRPPTVAELISVGCWNCHGVGHSYPHCPLPRRQSFCFGCGAQEVTLANCRRCGPRYQIIRPYTAPRDSRDSRRYVGGDEIVTAWPWMAK